MAIGGSTGVTSYMDYPGHYEQSDKSLILSRFTIRWILVLAFGWPGHYGSMPGND